MQDIVLSRFDLCVRTIGRQNRKHCLDFCRGIWISRGERLGVFPLLVAGLLRFASSRYPSQGHEMLFDAHTRSFAALGGVAKRGIYDNMKTAVDKVLKGKGRVSARLYPNHVAVVADDAVVARHERLSDRGKTRYDWQHYVPLLERKPGALRNGAPFSDLHEALQRLRRGTASPAL